MLVQVHVLLLQVLLQVLVRVSLTMLINKSIEYGTYPSKLKLAKVIPIYKSGDESDPSNYRPISLLSIFNRIFEKMMYNRLKSFIEKCNILLYSQYGFREKRSSEHAIECFHSRDLVS